MTSPVMLPDAPFLGLAAQLFRSTAAMALAPMVSDVVRCRLVRLAEQLPLLAHTAGFECRLSDHDQRVDFGVVVLPSELSLPEKALAQLDERSARDPIWARCTRFLTEWVSGSDSAYSSIPFCCLAFDVANRMDELPAPCVSLCVDGGFFARRVGLGTAARPLDDLEGLAQSCALSLDGEPLPKLALRRLRSILSPPDVFAKHLSFMLSRRPAIAKLDVRVPISILEEYLSSLESNDASAACRWIKELAPRETAVQLNLPLTALSETLLEVELFVGGSPGDVADRFEFLERLVTAGLCAAPKADVLRRATAKAVVNETTRSYARGWYVKVRFSSGEPVDAKAYVGFTPRISPATSARSVASPVAEPLGSTT